MYHSYTRLLCEVASYTCSELCNYEVSLNFLLLHRRVNRPFEDFTMSDRDVVSVRRDEGVSKVRTYT